MDTAGRSDADDVAAANDAGLAESLSGLAQDSGEYARTLARLAVAEANLAATNLRRLLIVALVVPAIAVGAVAATDAMLAAWLARHFGGWTPALAVVAAANLALLAVALRLLASWWRSLGLPRSRAALARLQGRP